MVIVSVLLEQLVVLFAHVASAVYSSELKYSKKITFFIWGVWLVLQGLIWYFAEHLISDAGLKFFLTFVSAFIFQYIIFFATTKGRLSQRLFTILTYSIFFCIFMAFYTAILGSFPNMHAIIKMIIHIALIFGIVYYFLKCVCPLCKATSKSIVKGWYPLVLVNCIYLVTIVLTSVFPVKITSIQTPTFITFVFLSLSIFAVYPIIFSNIKNMAEVAAKKEIEQQNKILLLQIEKENLQMAQDRRARHDRRHHNLVLLEFASNDDVENVKEYLKNLVENDSDVLGEINHCENPTINAVLSVYEKKAREEGIAVRIAVRAGYKISVPPQDLVIVIANLFENAINATRKARSKDKSIDIDIREQETRLLIKIENPCKSSMRFDEASYGIGINSVITTAEKHEGMCDFSVEDGIFSAKVCLNF